MLRTLAFLLASIAFLAPAVFAADDPSIRGELRTDIQDAMKDYLADQMLEGTFRLYDPVEGKLLRLEAPRVHAGIVKKGDYYVSCADFTDQDGRSIDVDFLVLDFGHEIRAVQGLVHKVDGEKRPYHLENN